MSETGLRQADLERLAAAALRDASPDELLDLADTALEQAAAAHDAHALERIAELLETVAAAHGPEGRGLAVAAVRARAAPAAEPTACEEAPPRAPVPSQATPCAGWGRRVAAFAVDWFVLLVAIVLVLAGTGYSPGRSWSCGSCCRLSTSAPSSSTPSGRCRTSAIGRCTTRPPTPSSSRSADRHRNAGRDGAKRLP